MSERTASSPDQGALGPYLMSPTPAPCSLLPQLSTSGHLTRITGWAGSLSQAMMVLVE